MWLQIYVQLFGCAKFFAGYFILIMKIAGKSFLRLLWVEYYHVNTSLPVLRNTIIIARLVLHLGQKLFGIAFLKWLSL